MLEVDLVSLKPALVRTELRASRYLQNHQIKEKLELSGNQRGCFSPNLWLQPTQKRLGSPGTRKQGPLPPRRFLLPAHVMLFGRLALQK